MSSPLVLPNGSGRFGREITADYNEINLLELDDVKQAKLEMWIAKNVGEVLCKHYPNREWGVGVDLFGGSIVIKCESLSTEKGYVIHLAGRNMPELQQRAVMAAGEILERYGVSRSRGFDPDQLESLKRDPITDDAIES